MLKISHSLYPYSSMSFWISFLSFSTVSAVDDAASPCLFISFNPILPLKCVSQPSLSFNLSYSGIPTKVANAFHFWRSTSLVSRILSFIAFETQRSIISETCGCSVCWTRLTFWSHFLSVQAHCSRHSSSCLSQHESSGCLSQRLG